MIEYLLGFEKHKQVGFSQRERVSSSRADRLPASLKPIHKRERLAMAKYVLVAKSFRSGDIPDTIVFDERPFPNLRERRAHYFYMPGSQNSPPKIYHIAAYNQKQDSLEVCLGNSYVVKSPPDVQQSAPFSYLLLKDYGFMEVTNGGFLIKIAD